MRSKPLSSELLSYRRGEILDLDGLIHVVEPGTMQPKHVAKSVRIGAPETRDDGRIVSCLMPTRNRLRQAQIAIDSFLRQTYARRELVIVDNSDDDSLASWAEQLDDPRISYISAIGSTDPVGLQRNAAVRHARGSYVCVWDDDDLHHPARLEAQMAAIHATKTKASFLSRELIWMTENNRLAVTDLGIEENTLLCEIGVMPVYPRLTRGSDTIAINRLLDSEPHSLLDQPELYIYVVHGKNLWNADHFEEKWRIASSRFEGPEAWRLLQSMSRTQPIATTYDALHGRGAWLAASPTTKK